MILIQKCISEDPDKLILVVSRLSRLISFVKSAVGNEKRDTSNISFFTYEDLLNHLSRRVNPMEESAVRTFAAFNQVHFGEMTGTGAASSISFEQDFVNGFLEEGERNATKKHLVEPITLWGAFRVIKLNVKCSETKAPLSREDYLELPRSFGLDEIQRAFVYQLYMRYSEWLNTGSFKWDEADRTLYIFQHGLSVFSHPEFISWEHRAFHLGQTVFSRMTICLLLLSSTIWYLQTKLKTFLI